MAVICQKCGAAKDMLSGYRVGMGRLGQYTFCDSCNAHIALPQFRSRLFNRCLTEEEIKILHDDPEADIPGEVKL